MNFVKFIKYILFFMIALAIANMIAANIPGMPQTNSFIGAIPTIPSSMSSTGAAGIIVDIGYTLLVLGYAVAYFAAALALAPVLIADILSPLGPGVVAIGALIGVGVQVTGAIGLFQWISGRYGVFTE